ncbi:hypothetical protein PAXRUDRAFT_178948, partial [Paxillus rubicundulus Ve08.2h10]
LAFAIIHSTTISLPAWHQLCCDAKLNPKLIPWDVVTRWNSTYETLCFVLAYHQPVDAVMAEKKYKLQKYELDHEEWQIIKDLVSLLEQAMLFFSQDSASIAAIILAMDKLNDYLNDATDEDYHPAIKTAMSLAQNKMDQYWQ